MKASEIQALLDEPACTHNKKEKSGCAKPKPGATAGGCSFDGAQIALLPIADVAHIVCVPFSINQIAHRQPFASRLRTTRSAALFGSTAVARSRLASNSEVMSARARLRRRA